MQELKYPLLNKCEAIEYIPKVGLIANFIKREKPDFKAFKKFVKQYDLVNSELDRDAYGEQIQTLVRFLDVEVPEKGPLKMGPFLSEYLTIIAPEDRQRYVFTHLMNRNRIMMKYVMDAVNERLQSVNELYRLLTSYAYPGQRILLPDFKAWIEWVRGCDAIRIIGVRYGLGDLGKKVVPEEIRFIDIDDELEEDSDEDEDEDVDDDEDDYGEDGDEDVDGEPEGGDEDGVEPPAALGPVAPPAPQADARGAEPAAATEPALGVGAASVADGQVRMVYVQAQPAASTPVSSTHVEVIVHPVASKPDELPLSIVESAFKDADEETDVDEFSEEEESAPVVNIARFRPDSETVARNLQGIRAWWRGRPGGRVLSSEQYSFSAADFEAEPAYQLFRLSALALSLFRYQGRMNIGRGGEAFTTLDMMGFYSNMMRSTQTLDDIISSTLAGGLGQRVDYFSNLNYLIVIRSELKKLGDEGVREIFAKPSIQEVLTGLYTHVGLGNLSYEIIWITRELATIGVLPAEDRFTFGVLPLPRVRENAFRLGFIETPYAADFYNLVYVSRRLSKLFGVNDDWEAPLVYFKPGVDAGYDSYSTSFVTRDQMDIDF